MWHTAQRRAGRWLLRRSARAWGFIDPLRILARLERFSRPAAVAWPLELLRAGVAFHARGLINTHTLQHNLDWVWPFWVERQFDPRSASFIPRAFSPTHVNLTHRNWTALGRPDDPHLPLVDPRGLLTPLFDSWSLDAWILPTDRPPLYPSRCEDTAQELHLGTHDLAVDTRCWQQGLCLHTRAAMRDRDPASLLTWDAKAVCPTAGWLVLALRPANPEGVRFVDSVRLCPSTGAWVVNHRTSIAFSPPPERSTGATFADGDIAALLPNAPSPSCLTPSINCPAGLATAAALFPLLPHTPRTVRVCLDLSADPVEPEPAAARHPPLATWARALRGHARLHLPDPLYERLYHTALRTLILLTPGLPTPGPYTYRRFWFRDAALMLHALFAAHLPDRPWRALLAYPERQTRSGFFHSQEGEWDANGAALWIFGQACALTGRPPDPRWLPAIARGVRWIARKRLPAPRRETDPPEAGLLPAGFSAEHLGLNDFYFWDDFWSIAGLRAAAPLLEGGGLTDAARLARTQADDLLAATERSLRIARIRLGRPAMPAAPARRFDAGAVGSLCAGYPLQLFAARDERLLDLARLLHQRHLVQGGFFQDMIHSGINPYLTLHLAQVFLRAGEWREAHALLHTVADLASPTGQWPEAIHPATRGGCMGDGQHGWAAAEWVLALRALFLREEDDGLVLAPGIHPEWLSGTRPLEFGPTPTRWGDCIVHLDPRPDPPRLAWTLDPRGPVPPIHLACPETAPQTLHNTPRSETPLVLL